MSSGERNSSDLILILGCVLLVCVGGAWLALKQPWSSADPAVDAVPALRAPTEAETPASPSPDATLSSPGTDERENLLERAALARQAGFLFEPENDSAWALYLTARDQWGADPVVTGALHELAGALLQQGNVAIDQGRLEAARALLQRLDDAAVEHDGTEAARDRFRRQLEGLIAVGMGHADNARWDDAEATLARAAALGATEAALASAREHLAGARERVAAEALAASEAERAPPPPVAQPVDAALQRFDAALAANRLLAPQQDNARQHLQAAQLIDPADTRVRAAATRLAERLLQTTREAMGRDRPDEAEGWLDAAEALGANSAATVAVRTELEQRLREAESQRLIPITTLTLRNYVAPIYPAMATRTQAEGWVDVEFTVNLDGRTEALEVVDASHERMFRNEAVRAISQWEFEPREFRGRPIPQRTGTRLTFRLQGN